MSQLEIAVVAILFFLVGFRVAVIAVLGLLIVRPVRDCPACFRTTVPVLVKWLPGVALPSSGVGAPSATGKGLAERSLIATLWQVYLFALRKAPKEVMR